MKKIILLFFILFIFQNLQAQKNKTIYIDADGKETTSSIFKKKLRNKDSLYSTWHYKDKKENLYMVLKKDLYMVGIFSYKGIKEHLEKTTQRKLKDSINIIIEFYYKNDLCSSSRNNYWTKPEVNKRKKFTNPIRDKLAKDGIELIMLFEKGMTLKNKPHQKNEYFFMDADNYFRKMLFTSPTRCGSYAIIKPNGQCIIRNGEYRADRMAKHLNKDIWQSFFKP